MTARSDLVPDTFGDLSTPALEGLNRESIRLMRRRLAKAVNAADEAVTKTEAYAMGTCPSLERAAYARCLIVLDEAKKYLAAETAANDAAERDDA